MGGETPGITNSPASGVSSSYFPAPTSNPLGDPLDIFQYSDPNEIISICSPNHSPDQVLTDEQSRQLIENLLGEHAPSFPASYLPVLIAEINRIANNESSGQITCYTEDMLQADPALADTIRLALLYIITSIHGLNPVPLAAPSENASPEINLTSEVLSDGIMTDLTRQALRDGTLRFEVRFSQNRQGEFDNFRVVMQFGWHEETVAEFRDGAMISGDPPESVAARGAITYLQRLLRGSDANRYTFREGVFGRNTLNAMYSFMARENLIAANFDVDSTSRIVDQRVEDAREALTAFRAAPSGSSLRSRHTRFELAKDALEASLRVIEMAGSYRDIQSNNLTREQRAFRDQCERLSNEYRTIASELLNTIMGPPGEPGLISLDVTAITAKMRDYRRARDRANRPHPSNRDLRKVSEEFDSFSGQTQRTLSQIRRWRSLAQHDPQLYQLLTQSAADVNTIVHNLVDENFPAEAVTVNGEGADSAREALHQQIASIDQSVIQEIEGNQARGGNAAVVRARFARAAAISETLGDNPARPVVIDFLRSALTRGNISDMERVFTGFNRLVGGNLQTIAAFHYNNSIRESQGLGGAEALDNDSVVEAMDLMGDSLNAYPSNIRGQIMNLAIYLYAEMEQHNILANADPNDDIEPLNFRQIADATGEVMAHLQDGEGHMISSRELRKTLDILANTSNDPQTAALEMAQQLDSELDRALHRDNRELRGSNSQLVITPQVIRQLEVRYDQSSTAGGVVSGADVARWGSLPEGSNVADNFHVSLHGVAPVSTEAASGVRQVPVNNLAGEEYERDPVRFMRNEHLATLKLAVASARQPISDAQVLMLHGSVTARLTHTDLTSINTVFGENNNWTFRPGSLQFSALEGATLRAISDMPNAGAHDDIEIGPLLRRLTSGSTDVQMTSEEKIALASWLSDTFPTDPEQINTAIAENFPALGTLQRQALRSAVSRLRRALDLTQRKLGLNTSQQRTLSDLAGYLAWADELPEGEQFDQLRRTIAIHDARLGSEEPADELVQALRQAAGELDHDFNEQEFRATYGESVRVLNHLHRGLFILASKYPPEEPGWEGLSGLLYHHYTEAIPNAMFEAVQAPAQSDFLMAGLPNDMNFLLNIQLYSDPDNDNDIVDELGSINTRLETLRDELNIELEGIDGDLNSSRSDEVNPLITDVRACQDLVSGNRDLNALVSRVLSGHQRDGEVELENDDRVRSYLSSYRSTSQSLEQLNENPTYFIVQADGLYEQTLLNLRQIDLAINAERNPDKRVLLTRVQEAFRSTRDRLHTLIETRHTVMPQFREKAELEIRRGEILDILSSDRFDRAQFIRLQRAYGERLEQHQFSWARVDDWALDFAGSIFSGDNGRVTGADGYTGQTVGQVLTAYFDTNNDGVVNDQDEDRSVNLSSLIPQPGEDSETITAKIALSQFLERLPRESNLNLSRSLPVMLFGWRHAAGGFFNALRDVPAMADGLGGNFGEIQYGPGNYAEMLETANSASSRLSYDFLSFLAMSGDEHPPMNMSAQVYMLLMQSQRAGVRNHLSASLTADTDNLPLSRVNEQTMRVFIEYLVHDIYPHLDSPRLRQRIEYLHETNRIPLSLEQIERFRDPETREARITEFLNALPPGDFQLQDSYHCDANLRPAARLVEAALRIVGEINQTRAVSNIELYPLIYFDPLQALQDNWQRYQSQDNIDSPRRISVIRYSSAPEAGDIDEAIPVLNDLDAVFTEDIPDWLSIYGPRILSGLGEEIGDDPAAFLAEAVRSSGAFGTHFAVFMGRQIEMGFTNTWGGLGELLAASIAGDRERAITALQQISTGLARATGAFTMFEVFPWIFYTDVLNEIENGNFAGAFGKAIVITVMTARSFRTTVEISQYLYNRGLARFHQGRLLINDTPETRRIVEQRLARSEMLYNRSIRGRLGLRLLNYQFNPFAWVNAARRGYRYMSSGLEVQISEAPVQVSEVSVNGEEVSRWRELTRPRTEIDQFLRRVNNGFNAPRRIVDLAASRTASADSFSGSSAMDSLIAARNNPGTIFNLTLTQGAGGGRMSITGEEYLRLSEAAATGEFRAFRSIVESHNLLAGSEYSQGSMRQLFDAFSNPGEAYQAMVETFDWGTVDQFIAEQTAEGYRTFDARRLVSEAAAGRGLNNTYEFNVTIEDPQTGERARSTVELTGHQVLEILHNSTFGREAVVVNEAVDSMVAQTFYSRINDMDMMRQLRSIGRRFLGRGRLTRRPAPAEAAPEVRTEVLPEPAADSAEYMEVRPEEITEERPVEERVETRAERSPEANAEAMARSQLLGNIAPVSTPAGPVTLALSEIGSAGECLAEGGTRFNLNLVDTSSVDIVTAEAVERLRTAGVEEIFLPEGVHPEVVREMVVSEEMMRSAGQGRTVAVVDGSGNAEILMPAEAAAYQPVQLTNVEALQHNALTEFRGAMESARVERLGETNIREMSFEQLETLSEKSVRNIMRENNLGRSQAEAVRDSARLSVTQFRFNQNLVSMAEAFGVSVNSGNAARVANMLYSEYAGRGAGQRFFNPERLFDFLGTEEGARFLASDEGRQFAERVAEMESRYRESHGQIGQRSSFRAECGGLLVSLGVFLGAERLADVLGIENPLAKTAFVLGLMHTATEASVPLTDGAWLSLMSTQTLREAGRGLIMLGSDLRGISSALLSRSSSPGLSGFRSFWQARFGNSPLIFGRDSLFARGAWRVLSDGAAWGRFFTSIGQFTVISHAYTGALDAADVDSDSIARHPVTSFLVTGAVYIGIEKLMTTVLAETMVSRLWTKVLGPIGIAFFVADMIDMANLAFMDEYNRSVTLEAREADYHGSDPYMDVNIRHMTNATRSWMNIISILRVTMLAADTYRGADGQAGLLTGISEDQFDHDQVRQLLLAFNEGEEGAGLREAIRNLQQMDPPDDLRDMYTDHSMLRRGVDGADRYFDDQGRFREDMIDTFINEELFGEFHADDEYRAGNNTYHLDFSASARQMENITSAMLANRRMSRISILYQRELTGQDLNLTEADRNSGYITDDGQLDHGGSAFIDFATRLSSNAFQATGPQAATLQTQVKLQIIRLRLAYLESNDLNILRELNVWGDTIDVDAWEQDQANMRTLMDELGSADLDPADPRSALIFAGYVSRLNSLVPEVAFMRDETGNRIINVNHQQNLSAIRAIDEANDRAAAEERGEVYVDYCANNPCLRPY